MRKLFTKCKLSQLKKNAAKVIKIQIKYMNRNWRKANEKIVSIPYQYVKFDYTDDWLAFEGSPEDTRMQALLMNEDEIRVLNSDFNYKHYGMFYEEMKEEEKEGGADGQEVPDQVLEKPHVVGFQKVISEDNILNQMWQRVKVDQDFY